MNAKRNVYLEMKPLAEARSLWLDRFDWGAMLPSEEIAVAIAAELIAIHRVGPEDLTVGAPLRRRRGPFAAG